MFGSNHSSSSDAFFHQKLGPVIGAAAVFILEVLQIIIISAAIVVPIRYFLVQPFNVKGASMEPNFHNNEYLIIDEISFRVRNPERGEIVVFRYPKDPSQYFIKRVIGLPGETIDITDGIVRIENVEYPNGFILNESYLSGDATEGRKKVTLGVDEYFVMGDNRDESMDSRVFGPVTKKELIGRVWIRGLPISQFSTFEPPVYQH